MDQGLQNMIWYPETNNVQNTEYILTYRHRWGRSQ